MDPHWFSSLNPDPPRDKKLDSDQCGSTTLLSRSIRSLQLFRDDIHGSLKNKKIQIFFIFGGDNLTFLDAGPESQIRIPHERV
jgi:hypothetical protein